MMTACNECGKSISDKAAACPNCGAPVEAVTAPSPAASTPAVTISVPWKLIAVAAVALVGFSTKPDISKLHDMVYAEALAFANNQKITDDDNIVSGILKFGCVLDARSCAEEIAGRASIVEHDLVVAKTATITLGEGRTKCFGAIGNWWCSDG